MDEDPHKSSKYDKGMLVLLATLFVVRVAMILCYPAFIKVMPMWEWANNDGYEAIAINWLEQGTFALQHDIPTAARLPLYPAMIAACYAIVGYHPVSVMLFQVLLSTVTGYILYLLAKSLFNKQAAEVTLLLFILHPHANNFVFRCATETLFIFITMVLVYSVVRYLQTAKLKHLVVFAVFLGLSLLTRQTYIYLALLGLPMLILSQIYKRGFLRVLCHVGFGITLVFLTITPWVTRNYLRSGYVPILQTWVGQPLFQGTYVSINLSEFLQGNKTVSELDQEALALINSKTISHLNNSSPESRPVAREVLADQQARHLAYERLLQTPLSSIRQIVINVFLAPVHK